MTAPRTTLLAAIERYGVSATQQRLNALIQVGSDEDCWEFTGAVSCNGYGRIKLCDQVHYLLHRIAWALANGREPGEMLVCHTCDNRRCCNPAHLFLGTAADNTRDMARKGRRAVQRDPRNRTIGTKLTISDVAAIQHDPRGRMVVAKEFGISVGHVSSIRCGRAWSDGGRAARRASKYAQSRVAEHVPTIENPTFHNGSDTL